MTCYRPAFWILLGIAIALRCYIVTLDMNILLDQGLVQDDAFYYYEIARNILANSIPSFDGINATNGFHPLWQMVCLPVFSIFDGDTAVRVMIAIASFFDILAIWLFCRILQSFNVHQAVVLFAVAVLGLHGTIIRTWFNGLETALGLCCLLWFLLQWLTLARQYQERSWRDHALLGAVAAITFLARTDYAVILLVLLVALYIPRLWRGEFKAPLASAAVFVVLTSPWLLANLFYFGSFVQVSGQLTGDVWLVGGTPQADLSWLEELLKGIAFSLSPLGNVFKKMFVPGTAPDLYGYPFLLLLGIAVVLAWQRDAPARQSLRWLLPFVIGVFVLFFYHSGVRHFVRGWYNAPVLLALTLMLCVLLDVWLRKLRSARMAILVIVLTTTGLLVLYSPYRYTRAPAEAALDPRVAAAQWLNTETPAGTRIGSANAGIIGFYSEHPVINLDGVVNAAALEARTHNRLHAYIKEAGIHYLADHRGSITHLCADNAYYRCELANSQDGGIQVMRVWPGRPP